MPDLEPALQNIADAEGIPIALTGLFIVFVALVLISAFLTVLPRILEKVATVFPEANDVRTAAPATAAAAPKPSSDSTEPELVAALAVLLHQRGNSHPKS